ncbi:hypothetical protein [Streptomyces caniscabiei]|uniref:hypothetical protein n=1 Tax=Streptomyces caniscabiei TaxID=2746961 RepID=UPI0029BB8F5E|nr:hypothetical protein [Streptomyces caniscabiei]MDX2986436.1 hypothetical protein [Streptomyces caniscabiei]
MAEHTPGYVAALAAALHQANMDALRAAENGDNQLGVAIRKHPGLRAWNGDLLRVGHLPKTPFAVECNALLPDDKYVELAHHEHVRIDPGLGQWLFCLADADGAVPITIAVIQTRIDDEDYEDAEPGPGTKAAATRRGLTTAQYLAKKNAGLKWCRGCKEWRPLSDYKPSTSTRDRVRPLCTRHSTPRQPQPITHGANGYQRGCRCPECRAGHAAYQGLKRTERQADPTRADRAGHGKRSTYINYGCRCPDCRAAQARYLRARRDQIRAQKGPSQ